MVNAEALFRAHLEDALQVPCFVAVPEDPPARFVTVERTGGRTETPASESATLAFDFWGPGPPQGRAQALALAETGGRAIRNAGGTLAQVARVAPNTESAHFPDPVSGRERYESTYNITINDFQEE